MFVWEGDAWEDSRSSSGIGEGTWYEGIFKRSFNHASAAAFYLLFFHHPPHSLDQNICCCNVHMSSDSYNYLNLPCSVPVPPFVFVLQCLLPIWEQISFMLNLQMFWEKKGSHLLKAKEWHSSYVSLNSSAVSWITAHRHFKFIVSIKTRGVDFSGHVVQFLAETSAD